MLTSPAAVLFHIKKDILYCMSVWCVCVYMRSNNNCCKLDVIFVFFSSMQVVLVIFWMQRSKG